MITASAPLYYTNLWCVKVGYYKLCLLSGIGVPILLVLFVPRYPGTPKKNISFATTIDYMYSYVCQLVCLFSNISLRTNTFQQNAKRFDRGRPSGHTGRGLGLIRLLQSACRKTRSLSTIISAIFSSIIVTIISSFTICQVPFNSTYRCRYATIWHGNGSF